MTTVSALNHPFASEIWSRHILLVAHHEPAIRNAVIALSSLHERWMAGGSLADLSLELETATKYYGKAIRLVLGSDFLRNDQAVDVALSTCILFTCYDILRGHYQSALSHVRSGVNLFAQMVHEQTESKAAKTFCFAPPSLYQEVFSRLDTQLVEISDASFQVSSALTPSNFDHAIPTTFHSIDRAAFTFDALVNSLLHLLHRPADDPSTHPDTMAEGQLEEMSTRQTELLNHFQRWCFSFQNMIDDRSRAPSSPEELNKWNAGTPILTVWRNLVSILLQISPTSGEMVWDQFEVNFRQVVSECRKVVELDRQKGDGHDPDPQPCTGLVVASRRPTFTMSLGIIQALWMVCVRCRNPVLRRDALAILRACRRREGVWDSNVAALVAERVIQMEEGAARRCFSATPDDGSSDVHLFDASDIPEHVRIAIIDPSFGPGRQARIRYTKVGSRETDLKPGASGAMTFEEVIRW